MSEELTPEDIQDVLEMGQEFEHWFNEQVGRRTVLVAHLMHIIGLSYARLRLQVSAPELERLIERKMNVMEEALQRGMRVKMGESEIDMILPTVEDDDRNEAVRDMLAALSETDEEIDAELRELLGGSDGTE